MNQEGAREEEEEERKWHEIVVGSEGKGKRRNTARNDTKPTACIKTEIEPRMRALTKLLV